MSGICMSVVFLFAICVILDLRYRIAKLRRDLEDDDDTEV